MIYLTFEQLLQIHRELIDDTGGSHGVRDEGLLQSAAEQPKAGFGGAEFYPTLADKAAALAFTIIKNHPCVDGNKRLGNAAVRVFLMINGHAVTGSVDERESVILRVAAGEMSREDFTDWLRGHIVPDKPRATP
jgi:death-on-curing protein